MTGKSDNTREILTQNPRVTNMPFIEQGQIDSLEKLLDTGVHSDINTYYRTIADTQCRMMAENGALVEFLEPFVAEYGGCADIAALIYYHISQKTDIPEIKREETEELIRRIKQALQEGKAGFLKRYIIERAKEMNIENPNLFNLIMIKITDHTFRGLNLDKSNIDEPFIIYDKIYAGVLNNIAVITYALIKDALDRDDPYVQTIRVASPNSNVIN